MPPTAQLPDVTPADEADILRRTEDKLRSKERTLRASGTLLDNIRLLFKMVRDRSFHMTWATRAAILGALLYFVIPTDATPDFIPVIGYLDDTVVVSLVIRRLAREIERYKEHTAWI
jgi:uncharacterized membrane protein YkvA (DUF1232 family)